MRHAITVLAAAATLAACATTTAPPGAIEPIAAPLEQSFALRIGALTPEDALRALGPAAVDRRDGKGALMTWRSDACALTLVFAADGAGRLRLAEAAAAEPKTGARLSADACVPAP